MPRSKREVRAVGITRNLGGSEPHTLQCAVCKRWLPVTAIHHTRRRPMEVGPHKGKKPSFCGECVRSGRISSEQWEW